MNGIIKSIAIVAVVSLFLSACGGESSGESTGTMSGGSDLSLLSESAKRGHSIYVDPSYACATCHGVQGDQGLGGPVNGSCEVCTDLEVLTAYNDAQMPWAGAGYSPEGCVGECAADVSAYIYEGFVQGKALPGASNDPAINVNPTSGLTTTEAGGMATFTVSINSLPTDDVNVSLASSNAAEGTVSTAALTFTSVNWNQPQTVMVTGADDANLDGNVEYTINITAMSNDVNYAEIDPADVTITNNDDEIPPPGEVNIDPLAGLETSEDGDTATFTIALGTVPTADVSIGLSTSNAAEGSVMPASVVFNPANYNIPQTVTVTGLDDVANPMVDGPIAYSVVTAPAVSNDLSYTGFDASDIAVTNADNDVQPVISAFTADPVSNAGSPIPYGGMVTLNWSSDGDACAAGGANAGGQWTGALLANSMQTLTNLTTAGVNQFALTCSSGGIDSVVATVDVTVMAQPGAPVVNLTADPTMLAAAGNSTLTWSTTDASSCVATSNPVNTTWNNAAKGLAGTQVIPDLTAPTNTFSLACTNDGGLTTQQDVTVTVAVANPTVTLTANPTSIAEGGATTLTWNTTDMASCTAVSNPVNAEWTGAKGVLATQNQAVNGLFSDTTFTLNCIGTNGAAYNDSVAVTIDPTSTGEYLYNNELFGGALTCANAACHGPNGAGVITPLNDKADLCTNLVGTAGIVNTIVDTMPIANEANCGAACATKILNYMFENFYGGNTTDCEGGALPLAIP